MRWEGVLFESPEVGLLLADVSLWDAKWEEQPKSPFFQTTL